MKLIAFIVFSILAALVVPSICSAAEKALDVAPVANESARADLVSFLEEARNYTQHNGMDEALKAFCDPDGRFVRGDMYIFAYDFNGTLLAHPYLHGLIGRNNLDLIDQNGVHIIKNLIEVAKRGSGFAYNVYPNPGESNRTELKLLYVQKVNDGMWIGSGIYLPGGFPLFSFEDLRNLLAFVEKARGYALKNGRIKALQFFNDPDGEFVRGDMYIFAYDFLGNQLSLPFQPDLVGTNRLNVVDANGVAFARDNLDLAHNGSGQVYYIYPNPKDNTREELKLSYATRVDDGWWLASGIYSNPSAAKNLSAMKPICKEELKTFVDEARSYALVVGKEKALRDFMDLNGSWVRGEVYIFAQDFNGTALCLPYLPQEVGTFRLDVRNDRGVYINREMRDIASKGGGFFEYTWRNPISNINDPKISYVSKVDDTWWLGAGIYGAGGSLKSSEAP
jgi:signal transduction histidine kinase